MMGEGDGKLLAHSCLSAGPDDIPGWVSCTDTRKPAAREQSASSNSASSNTDGDTCPYLPSFPALRNRIARLDASAGLAALNAYQDDPRSENPNACQSMALDALMDAREQALVTLRLADGKPIPAHTSYRCGAIDPRTTACRGAVEDGTAHPYSIGVFRDGAGPIALTGPTTAMIASALSGAKLEAVYRLNVATLLDGGRAKKLRTDAPMHSPPTRR